VDTYSRATECDPGSYFFGCKTLGKRIKVEGTNDGSLGVIRLIVRRSQNCHHGIADKLVEGAFMGNQDFAHTVEIGVQQGHQFLWFHFF